jgi:glycerol-3-phosphate dehydrogenase
MKLEQRRQLFEKISTIKFDVIIIGGGITGSGIIRDTTKRGLKSLLVEKNDFSSGTSSKTGKLIHGGLRYLEHAQLKLVFESCMERHRILKIIAPHIVKPTKFIFPFFKSSKHPRWFVALGLFIYDLLSLFRNINNFKFISKKEIHNMEPNLQKLGSIGALSYFDCTAIDTRLTIDTIKSASEEGADIFSYTEVKNINFSNTGGALVNIFDRIDQREYEIETKTIINATGVWADEIINMAKLKSNFNLKMTSGIHLIFAKDKIPVNNTITFESIDDKRPLYIVPWNNFIILGTTDKFYDSDKDNLSTHKNEIDYLLAALNHYFPNLSIEFSDILNITIGIRPLIGSSSDKKESQVSRDYEIIMSPKGMLSITGGKLTTYRHMAEKIVDKLIYNFFPAKKLNPCSTISPISGGNIHKLCFDRLNKIYSINHNILEKLVNRYGQNAIKILDLAKEHPEKLSVIDDNLPYLWAELEYITNEEHIEKLSDIFCRRTLISFTNPVLNDTSLNKIGTFVGSLKGWSENKTKNEIKTYLEYINSTIKWIRP